MAVHAGDLVRPACVHVVRKCDRLVRRVSASLDLHISEASNQDGDQCECGGSSQQSELRSTHHTPNVYSIHSAFCAPVHPSCEPFLSARREHMRASSSAQECARVCGLTCIFARTKLPTIPRNVTCRLRNEGPAAHRAAGLKFTEGSMSRDRRGRWPLVRYVWRSRSAHKHP